MNDTGWQSWSKTESSWLHLPVRNFSPFPQSSFAPKKIKQVKKPAPRGWSSWASFGTAIHHDIFLSHANFIKKNKLPIHIVHIDDGWCMWGDWDRPDPLKFPDGIGSLSEKLSANGFTTGLWIAPFLVHPDAIIVKTHPEWLVRDNKNRPIDGRKITHIDSYLPYRRFILDFTKKSVQKYLFDCIETMVTKWHIGYIKIDFLYALHFHPKFHASYEPDTYLHTFLSTIKKKYPSLYIAACGCPLRPAQGVVDSMRISEDIVNPQLMDKKIINTFIHQKRLIQLEKNLEKRKTYEKFWHLDCDVFVSHPKFGHIPSHTIKLASLIQKSQGPLFLGDDLINLPKKYLDSYIVPLLTGKPFF